MLGQQPVQSDKPFKFRHTRFGGRIAQDDFGATLDLTINHRTSSRSQRRLHCAKLVQYLVAWHTGFNHSNHRAQMARRCFQAANDGAVLFRRRQPIAHGSLEQNWPATVPARSWRPVSYRLAAAVYLPGTTRFARRGRALPGTWARHLAHTPRAPRAGRYTLPCRGVGKCIRRELHGRNEGRRSARLASLRPRGAAPFAPSPLHSLLVWSRVERSGPYLSLHTQHTPYEPENLE